MTEPTPEPIPVAVAVDGARPPAWQARALELVRRSPRLRLVEVRSVPVRPLRPLWRAHARIERRLFRIGLDALSPAPIDAPPAGGPRPRLLIWLAAGPPPAGPGPVLWLAHGPRREGAVRAFARAVLHGAGSVETEARLAGPEPVVVERTVSGVRAFSATLSANLALWKCAELAVRAAERAAQAVEPAPPPAPPEPAVWPGRFFARSLWRWRRALLIRLLFRRPWSIEVRRREAEPGGAAPDGGDLVRWRPGHVYADPFLFEHDGGHHLFCEEVPAGASRGVISHVELREGEPAAAPQPVLQAEHHLSYPHVFAHDGEVLLVPETSAARRVELHRAVRFPHEWRLDTVLLDDLDVVDATLLEHDGRWWLFAGVAAHGASHLDELHLFSADGPRGPWLPHPRNPVVSDVRAARPAGAILRCGDRLVRPAQDGSRRYGWAVSLREIDVLSASAYAEHEIDRLGPDSVPGARALHTYARDSRYEAIDVRRREPRLRIWRALAARLGRDRR